MSDRERWTIYPLLFLALALGLRDKIFQPAPPAPPSTMTLRQLTILGHDNRANIVLSGSDIKDVSPAIRILDAKGKAGWVAAVVPKTGASVQEVGTVYARDIRVVGPDGKPRVAIVVAPGPEENGVIEWFSANQKRLLVAGGVAGPSGAITSFRDDIEQFSVGSNERGTIVVARGPEGKPYLLLTCDEDGTGRALMFDREGKGQLLVGQPVDIKIDQVHPDAPTNDPSDQPPTDKQPPADSHPPTDDRPKPLDSDKQPATDNPAAAEPVKVEPTPNESSPQP